MLNTALECLQVACLDEDSCIEYGMRGGHPDLLAVSMALCDLSSDAPAQQAVDVGAVLSACLRLWCSCRAVRFGRLSMQQLWLAQLTFPRECRFQ